MDRFKLRSKVVAVAVALGAAALTLGVGTPTAFASTAPAGTVYVETNAASGNAVLVYDRAQDGTVRLNQTVSTGGDGTGAGLGSQGALALGANGLWLFAVNAGSDSISTFRVAEDGRIRLADVTRSGGTTPISLAASGTLVYVVNAGSDQISGFAARPSGLKPLAGSTLPLSGSGVGPAQIQFRPGGGVLVVTEKNTNLIDTYTVDANGLPSGPRTHASAGATPFGFAFRNRHLVVSEAFGGAAGASAASSYNVGTNGSVKDVSASVADGQGAACWVAISESGVAFVSNTGSNDVSSYGVSSSGSLSLLDAVAGATGAGPADSALAAGDRFLYVANGGDGTISAFRVRSGGALSPIAGVGGLPVGAAGLVAR